jgi:hypothetical protein
VEIFASEGAALVLLVLLIAVANLALVSMIPAANLHLKLLISLQIFEKIRNGPKSILRGLGETDS